MTPGASATLKAEGGGQAFAIPEALKLPRTQVRVFGKSEVHPSRRMVVALSATEDVEIARTIAKQAASMLKVEVYENEQ